MLFPTASDVLGHQRDDSMASTSLLQCYRNGRFDSTKFLLQRKREYESDDDDDPAEMSTTDWGKNDPPSREEQKKRKKRIILARRTEDGELESIPPTDSLWYHGSALRVDSMLPRHLATKGQQQTPRDTTSCQSAHHFSRVPFVSSCS